MVKKSINISERAYLHIRESLLSSGVYVGQKIPHLELGQRLRISHTPLREALFRLAAEGLLAHENYRGFFLAEMGAEEAREIYEAREVIEPYLAERAAKNFTELHAKAFSRILEDYKRLVSEPYSRKRLLTDKKFHMEIALLAGNNILAKMLNQMYDKLILKRPIQHLSLTRAKEAYKEHSEIFQVLKKKDGKTMAALMRNHIRLQREFVLKDIKNKLSGASMSDLGPMR